MFLKWLLFDWLAYLSHSGKLSSCRCRTLYWLFGTFLLFVAGAVSPSSFEPSFSSSSSLTGRSRRTLLWSPPMLGALSPLNHELKKTHVDDWRAAQTDMYSQNAYDIFSAPLSSDGLERKSSGKALRPRGWIYMYSQTRSTGPNGHPSWTDKDNHAPCAITFGTHRRCPLWKKSLVANLSAKRQLSVAKLSTKTNFSLAKRDFLVANGRMAADFSSPVSRIGFFFHFTGRKQRSERPFWQFALPLFPKKYLGGCWAKRQARKLCLLLCENFTIVPGFRLFCYWVVAWQPWQHTQRQNRKFFFICNACRHQHYSLYLTRTDTVRPSAANLFKFYVRRGFLRRFCKVQPCSWTGRIAANRSSTSGKAVGCKHSSTKNIGRKLEDVYTAGIGLHFRSG